jgi:hypothetical protein
MKVRSSTRATSDGSEQARKEPGRLAGELEGAGIDQLLAQAVVLFLRAVAPVDLGGLHSAAISATQAISLGFLT